MQDGKLFPMIHILIYISQIKISQQIHDQAIDSNLPFGKNLIAIKLIAVELRGK
jgi:hypothetical protein